MDDCGSFSAEKLDFLYFDDTMVLHEARDTGRIAGANAAGLTAEPMPRAVPLSVMFCEPQIALVGETRRELEGREADFVVGGVDWSGQGRARMIDEATGRLNVYVDVESGQVLGAEMFAPRAEHLAHLVGLAMTAGLTVTDILRMPVYHPTLEEGLKTALEDADDKRRSVLQGRGALENGAPIASREGVAHGLAPGA